MPVFMAPAPYLGGRDGVISWFCNGPIGFGGKRIVSPGKEEKSFRYRLGRA